MDDLRGDALPFALAKRIGIPSSYNDQAIFPGATPVDDADPRVSVGVGFSWRSPIGLINIDFGKAVVKKDYDKTQIFRLGFGTRF